MIMARFIVLLTLALSASAHAQNNEYSLGVTTHFSQGWPISLMDRAENIGVKTIRDSLHWPMMEQSPGEYDFASPHSLHIKRACAAGMKVLLVLEPRNPLYDRKMTAHSPAAQIAFANYVRAIAARYSGCVIGVEIGNEINGLKGMTGAASLNRAASHSALLKAVYQRVKPAHPDFVILGGSTNVIATGFLENLFKAGALQYMDGVAVHPYRQNAEALDWELDRLNAAMNRAGNVKPIWVTEFSREFANPADAAPFYLKMLSLMQAAGVSHIYWYALVDQTWFPTMGLLTQRGEAKPASRAFAYAASQLVPLGQAQRVNHGDPTLFHFRYGPSTHVVWGARRRIIVDKSARFRQADGSIVQPITELSNDPVIIEDAKDLRFGKSDILADSRYGFARPPITWFARSKLGIILPLVPIDWKWTSYLGNKAIPQMIVNPTGIGPTAQYSTVVRYTAEKPASAFVLVCLSPLNKNDDGLAVTIMHNGKQIWSELVGPSKVKQVSQMPVALQAGDNVELIIAPRTNPAAYRMSYLFRISHSATDLADC
jgi:hypothetical protein